MLIKTKIDFFSNLLGIRTEFSTDVFLRIKVIIVILSKNFKNMRVCIIGS